MAANRSFPTNVGDAGHQNHFLTVPSLDGAGGPGHYFETLFQSYEGPADLAIRAVEAAIDAGVYTAITQDVRAAISRFIALQHLRTPSARESTLQMAEITRRLFAEEISARVGFNIKTRAVATAIESFSQMSDDEFGEGMAKHILNPQFIDEFGNKLARHVWILGANSTSEPLYIADHPVAVFGHADRPGRGLGPLSYGAELVFPLSSRLQLSLYERKFIRAEAPFLEAMDGELVFPMTTENVKFQQSVQTQAASQFIYCLADKFEIAKRICDGDPELRDPKRARIEALAFGKRVLPRRRT